jgi:DNA-directed RNA polymerase subunit K/omega
MSDNEEEYPSDSETGSEVSTKIKKKFNKKTTISEYNDDDDDDDDDDTIVVDDDENDENNDDDKNINVNENDSDDDNQNDVINIVEDDDDIYDDEEIDEDDDDDESDDEENDDQTNDINIIGGAKTTKGKVKQIKKTNIPIEIENNDTLYEDDDEQDDNYLQKFDKEVTKNYIMNFHPECLNHNYDEIKALSIVTRDEFNIIIDPLHKTVPFLTKYEKARILGQRAKQIECGAKPLVKVPENIIDGYLIAELELEQKAVPFIIRRPIPSGGSEYWNLKDLEIISF